MQPLGPSLIIHLVNTSPGRRLTPPPRHRVRTWLIGALAGVVASGTVFAVAMWVGMAAQ